MQFRSKMTPDPPATLDCGAERRSGRKSNTALLTAALALLLVAGAPRVATARPPIIDFHTHLDSRAGARIERIMRRNGIELMVNLSGGNFQGGIARSTRLSRTLPGKLVHFYNPDWSGIDEPDWGVREAHRLELAVTRHGFKGLKIAKLLGLYLRDSAGVLVDVDDPRLDPLWERAGTLGIPVSVHTGDPGAFWRPLTPQNERFEELRLHPAWSFWGQPVPSREALLAARDRVIDRHPLTTFVCVHFGGNPEDIDAVRALLATYPNAYVDIAARVPEIGRHDAGRVRQLFLDHQDRILFGTDIGIGVRSLMLGSTGDDDPTEADAATFFATHWRFFETNDRRFAHPTPVQGDWVIDAIGLPESVLHKIYRGNALRLLGLGQ